MKKLIIAEKPSVAKNIADALKIKVRKNGYFEGEEYLITWAFGHLIQLYDTKDYNSNMAKWNLVNFPFIPDEFKYKIKTQNNNKNIVDEGAKKQVKLIDTLIKRDDVSDIISATDYDREGQVIADELFLYLDVSKTIYRLLLNEWTPKAVIRGLGSLILNTKVRKLQDAGFSRQLADWMIGINLTTVATLQYNFNQGKVLNIGRVLLPTLKIIYDRDKEIEDFQSSKYYKLIANFIEKNTEKDNQKISATYYENNTEKHLCKKKLTFIKDDIKGKNAKITKKDVNIKNDYPPSLFNLTNLQGYITSKYKGWTSSKVLEVAQSLYEKKYITYPRTASSYLDETLYDKTKNVLNNIKKGLSYENEIVFSKSKRIFNSSKVESHSAIIPTYMLPKSISEDEKKVYKAIKDRFIMQFMPVAQYEETQLVIKVLDSFCLGEFRVNGKIQKVEGWKKVERVETKDVILPDVKLDDELVTKSSTVKEITKKPPKHHNEKTLLKVMETCGKKRKSKKNKNEKSNNVIEKTSDGINSDEKDIINKIDKSNIGLEISNNILDDNNDENSENINDELMQNILSGYSIGTPATRADTIKKLLKVGYIKQTGKSLLITELGKIVVNNFPVQELFDLDYTGRLEKTLSDIEKGDVKKEEFVNLIKNFTKHSVGLVKNDLQTNFKTASKDLEVVGKCPLCGQPIVEKEKNFGCTNWRNGCKYTIWKNDRFINSFGKEVNKEMVKILLKNGKVGFRKLKSKNGKYFSAYLRYEFDKDKKMFSWKLEFIN